MAPLMVGYGRAPARVGGVNLSFMESVDGELACFMLSGLNCLQSAVERNGISVAILLPAVDLQILCYCNLKLVACVSVNGGWRQERGKRDSQRSARPELQFQQIN